METENCVLSIQTWERKKKELLSNINTLMYGKEVDPEVLEIMRELVNNVKVKIRMADYFNSKATGDGDDQEVDIQGREGSY